MKTRLFAVRAGLTGTLALFAAAGFVTQVQASSHQVRVPVSGTLCTYQLTHRLGSVQPGVVGTMVADPCSGGG